MSEPKKQLKIEQVPEGVSAADTMGGPMPAEETERRKGLPADGEAWTHKHDMVVMGRLGRAVEGVPAAALRRIMPWFEGVTREVMHPAQAAAPVAGQVPLLGGPLPSWFDAKKAG